LDPCHGCFRVHPGRSLCVVSDTLLTGGWADSSRMSTEIIAMTSRNMMSKLVDHLDLMENPNYNPELIDEIDMDESALRFSPKKFLYNLFSKKSDIVLNPKSQVAKAEITRNNIINLLTGTLRVNTIGHLHISNKRNH